MLPYNILFAFVHALSAWTWQASAPHGETLVAVLVTYYVSLFFAAVVLRVCFTHAHARHPSRYEVRQLVVLGLIYLVAYDLSMLFWKFKQQVLVVTWTTIVVATAVGLLVYTYSLYVAYTANWAK